MMNNYLKLSRGIITLLAFACFNWAYAQQSVSGRITDASDGSGIPGVNVVEKGTTNGTITDFDGNYTLNVQTGATLVVSFVGYVTQELEVGSASVLDISMPLDIQALEEIVVVGYGTQEKKEITSAVVALDAADFNQGQVNDAAQLLQGKVPGLSVYNKGGDPNTSPTMRLRGISTVGANTEPLVVIDGVIGASLDNVDPNDIESLNVLKDGSAAAIYGSRGSSGVILVTTKGGRRGGGVQADYNAFVSAAVILKEQPIMTTQEYIDAGGNDLGGATDWQEEVTETGWSHVHNVSISGGSENTTFRLSTNFREINGILKKSGFDQINARANINHFAIDDKLQLSFNMSLTNRESDFSFREALRYATLFNPSAPIRFANGEFFQAVLFDNFNPVAILEQNENVGTSRTLNFNIKGDFNITDELLISANLGQQYSNEINGEFYPSTSFFRGFNRTGLARRFTKDQQFTLFETYATFSPDLDNLGLNITAGYSFQEEESEDFLLEAGNFPSDDLGFNILESSGDRVLGARLIDLQSSITPEERIIAFFGRVNLTIDDGIFFNASLRREGSTKLGPDNRWGIFPAVGAGVDLNKYLSVGIDQLKLRVGFGVTGSLPRQSGLSQVKFEYNFDAGGTVFKATDGNPDLQWEEKTEVNIGLDLGFMDNRISAALDVYTRTITDFILEVDVDPAVFPSGRQFQNVGELKTNGAELAINFDAVQGADFSWNTGVVLSTFTTSLEEFSVDQETRANLGSPGQNSTNMIRVAVGEDIGQIWGPRFSGNVDASGAPIMVDINGDGMLITDQGSALAPDGDFEELGNGLPDLELGWTNQLSYKNFDLNAFFRGAFGHSLVNTFRAFYEPIDPGAINSYNRIQSDKADQAVIFSQFSSLYVEKAGFFKLDNVTLGYNFDVSNVTELRAVRLYFSIQNAFVITNYSGIDPEPVLQDFGAVSNADRLDTTTPDVLAPGIDRRLNYFTSRTFTFGVNVGF